MTKWMWNPCLDTQCENHLQDYVANRDGYEVLKSWSDIKKGDDVIVVGHEGDDPSRMSGIDTAAGMKHEVDYNCLAEAFADGVQNPGLAFQIKLYMCNGAHRVKVGDKKVCFGGQLLSALKAKGYKKVKVAAYHGEIAWAQGYKHKIVCTRKTNPRTLTLGEQAKGLGILVVKRKGYGAARHRREWFTNNPLGTRWL